jgi:hypothetical protein
MAMPANIPNVAYRADGGHLRDREQPPGSTLFGHSSFVPGMGLHAPDRTLTPTAVEMTRVPEPQVS